MKAKYKCENSNCNAKWSITKEDSIDGKCEKCGTPINKILAIKLLIIANSK